MMNNYDLEVKQRWGKTDAYKEHAEKTANYTKDKWQDVGDRLMTVFAKFAECMKDGNTAGSDEAQALVKELQNYITENYYTCTNEILAGLGQMYVADERFRNNIDKHTPGTAAFVSQAIAAYCEKQYRQNTAYNSDGEGTHILYESVEKAVCNVRASAPLSADWSGEINADYQQRGKKK